MSFIILGRAAFVFPLSALSNYTRKSSQNTRITFRHQVVIWWAGLMRGAVSIALAFSQFSVSGTTKNPEQATMITSTIIVVLFSTTAFGILTKPLIGWIHPQDTSEISSPKDVEFEAELQSALLPQNGLNVANGIVRRSSFSLLIQRPSYTIHYLWRKLDDSYMQPVFGGRGFASCAIGSQKEGDYYACNSH